MACPVAVIGFGAFGRNHARVYAAMDGVELAAIVDPDPARREEAKRLYPQATVGDSLDAPVVAASVAVPTEAHVAVALELLRRGIPCLVEKPIAPSVEEAERLIAGSGEARVPVFVGHLERFNPALLAARDEIEAPRFIEVHRMGSFSPRSLDIDVVLDLMVHDLDVILTLAGALPVTVDAIGVNVLTRKVDIANARLAFADGLVANVTASRVSKEKIRKLRIFQPHCYISIDFVKRSYETYRVEAPREPGAPPAIVGREVAACGEEPLKAEIQAFLASALEGAPPTVLATAEEGMTALRLALEIVRQMDARARMA